MANHPNVRWMAVTGVVDSRNDVREFLATRRARFTPQQAGLATYGRRRVPGLRREEVAMLAGALHLDEAERAHLYDLARVANATPRTRGRPTGQQVRPGVQRILDGMTAVPAVVLNARLDLLAANRLGHALYSPVYADPTGEHGEIHLSRPSGACVLSPLG